MGLYLRRDIETDDGGEIQFENGDIKIADSRRSHLQALNWVVLSNRGDVIETEVAGDLGDFFGAVNIPRTHRAMEHNLRRAILEQRLFLPQDTLFRVVPVDMEAVAVTARANGQFIDENGETIVGPEEILGYVFPFGTGVPTKVSN